MEKRDDLWNQYMETRDPALREEIIVQNIPLVRYILGRLMIPMLDDDAFNDLLGQGMLGLIDAVDRFEPERGLRFSTYATLRIRGCILDALRAMDTLPRGARQRVKKVEQTISRLRMKLGREPGNAEVASAVDLNAKAYRAALIEANCAVLSIDTPFEIDASGATLSLADLLVDEDSLSLEETVERAELEEQVAKVLRHLPHRSQLLLALYYCEGLTMKEIGQVLDLSESRVSQLHARAMERLRAALEPDGVISSPAPTPRLTPRFAVPVLAGG